MSLYSSLSNSLTTHHDNCRSSDVRSPSHEPGEAANNGDAFESSAKDDDVKMLLSQMHDLSFMLEDNLSIPSSSNDHNSSIKD